MKKQPSFPKSFTDSALYKLCRDQVVELARAGVSVDLRKVDDPAEPSMMICEALKNPIMWFKASRTRLFVLDPDWGKAAVEHKTPNVTYRNIDGEMAYVVSFNWDEVRGKIANDPFHTRVFPASFRFTPKSGAASVTVVRLYYGTSKGDATRPSRRWRDGHALPISTAEHPVPSDVYSGAPRDSVPDLIRAEFYPVMQRDEDEDEPIPTGFFRGKTLLYASGDFDPENYGKEILVRVLEENRMSILVMAFSPDEPVLAVSDGSSALQTTVRELGEDEILYNAEIVNIWTALESHGVKPGMSFRKVKEAWKAFARKLHTDKEAMLVADFKKQGQDPPSFLTKMLAARTEEFKRGKACFDRVFERLAREKAAKEEVKAEKEAADEHEKPEDGKTTDAAQATVEASK